MKKRQNGSSLSASGNAQRHSGPCSKASAGVLVRPSRSPASATRGATPRSALVLDPRALRVGALADEDRARGALLALADLRVEARERYAGGARDADVPLAVRAGHEHADPL